MKILFTRFPLESAYGGAEIQTITLMKGLIQKGNAVAFLGSCPVVTDLSQKEGIPSVHLDIGSPPVTKWGVISFPWRKKFMQRKLEHALENFHDIDVIVMLSLSEKILLTPLALKKGIKVVWWEHDTIGRWLTQNPSLPTLKKMSAQVTTVTVSELSKKMYVDLGWPTEQVIAIPNGIDMSRFAQWKPVPHTEWTVGCAARLSPEKGVDLLIDAVNPLKNIRLIINGEGPEESSLRRRIRGDHIHMQPRTKDIGDFYAGIDTLMLPSRAHDPFGLVAAEAMLLGIPVLITDACGIAGYLTNEKDAIIVKANSAAELRRGLEILSDPQQRVKIGNAGKSAAESLFSADAMINRYLRILSA